MECNLWWVQKGRHDGKQRDTADGGSQHRNGTVTGECVVDAYGDGCRSFVRSSVRALCEAPERAEGNPACGKSGLSANVGNCVNWGGTTRGLGGGTRKKKGGARRHDDAGREKREIRSDASIFFFFSGSGRAERGGPGNWCVDRRVCRLVDRRVSRSTRTGCPPFFSLSFLEVENFTVCVERDKSR